MRHQTRPIGFSRLKKNIVVLGGDGFCGWPTALRLSAVGHSVTIIDNLSRRRIDAELGDGEGADPGPLPDAVQPPPDPEPDADPDAAPDPAPETAPDAEASDPLDLD